MKNPVYPKIAFFVTHHGFGHAARACAVMAALRERDKAIGFEIYSTAPEWFFQETIGTTFGYHPQITDIGMMQTSPFHADLQLTIKKLNRFLPFEEKHIHDLSDVILQTGCGLIVCDIAPMGIAVAEAAGIPSLLIENFTWDWIYNDHLPILPELKSHINYLDAYFEQATYHIQTEPVCEYRQSDLLAGPACRKSRIPAKIIRKRLGIPVSARVILLTFGGVPNRNNVASQLHRQKDVFFIIPGAFQRIRKTTNTIMLPHHSAFYHPDLIRASDVVIGKAGYSTIAEVYHAGIPFGYISKPHFREAPILEKFIKQYMTGRPIHEKEFYDGSWGNYLPELLSLTSQKPSHPNGADQIADFIFDILE
jgi:UDP:flavonoid glycosyltransferase YjiC (YdhE family)